MSWLTYLAFHRTMTQPPRLQSTHKALCLARKASGLFDTGSTSVAPNVTTLVDSWPEDSYNLFAALEAEDDIFADSTHSLLPSLEESLNSGMAESDFLEGFMDLSSFLGLEEDLAAPVEAPVEQTRKAVKRAAPEALTTDLSSSYPDHDCYISKKSRLASDSSCAMSDCESEAMPSCSTAASREEKYRHRREKNNVASKRSRQSRKMKFTDMEKKAEELEKTNAELREKVELLEQLTKQMKDTLVKKLSAK